MQHNWGGRDPTRRALLAGVAILAKEESLRARESSFEADCQNAVWRFVPPTPSLPTPVQTGRIAAGTASLWFAEFGNPESDHLPVVLLHGGLANSNYWGNVLPKLAGSRRVFVLDTRGHGRSTWGGGRLSYALLASDVIRFLDAVGVSRAAIAGWSDGGITGLALAMAHPDRIGRLFTFGANFDATGGRPGGDRSPTFQAFERRCAVEYRALSPEPARFDAVHAALVAMWRTEPRFSTSDLAHIVSPTTITAGQFDEIIARQHTIALAQAIPGARLVIEPCVSHFALLQNPARFANDVLIAL